MERYSRLIQESVLDQTGVLLNVSDQRQKGLRRSFFTWIDGYTKQDGPIFEIRPHGLKRIKITATMGVFSLPCIKVMQKASEESVNLSRSLIKELSKSPDVTVSVSPNQTLENWVVTDQNFEIGFLVRSSNSRFNEDALIEISKRYLAPLLVCFAELIGYVEVLSDIEGKEIEYFLTKKERSKRNRILCISIHGDKCNVCGLSPTTSYPIDRSIIEVHHIEPLASIDHPRAYDPRTDLIPLCPNCHRVLHTKSPPLHPNKLKIMMKEKRE